MRWTSKKFDALSINELYEIMKLRVDVFVVEQDCPYPELDDYDQEAIHLYAVDDEKIVSYSRIIAPSVKYNQASIGRVITLPPYRRDGLGTELINRSIEIAREEWPENDYIKIQAQAHLQRFYENCGFVVMSEEYLEDNIPHIDMIANINL
ncbi:GNAT family N-acetyltransferase [Halalkalibacillus sediminis]|uniref:GNAT family N-acetyltransferase n=1 Tax=Halalkalibacillus sediminis TaxID=2018042 RepID=A0A2I0QRU7_9BACI|nr:GNAT family N-acetyltransferase [Halalkalibacillus sediminis]PKR77053.1 GNAT family N-acetyltransferase [Halalkalibacillus sediminis]